MTPILFYFIGMLVAYIVCFIWLKRLINDSVTDYKFLFRVSIIPGLCSWIFIAGFLLSSVIFYIVNPRKPKPLVRDQKSK